MKEDKKAVGDELFRVVDGQSIVKTAEKLDIDPTGCKRLYKEFRRM